MSKDKYFDLRQSTRAYQNPYEAGGIGVGGLTQSARFNRQQVGSSFLSAPSGTNTWSGKSGRTASRGGMVNMPTEGPTPEGGPPDRPQKMGPAGPRVMAQGVEGRFDRPSEATWDPSVAGAGIEGALRGVGAVAAPIGRALKRKYDDNKATNERLKKADYDVGLTIDLKRGLSDMESVRLGTKKAKPMLALPAAKTPFDRQAQKISMTESMGRSQFGPLREPTGGVIPMGPVIETTATPSKPATSRTQSREWLSDPERARQAGSRSNIPLIWR